MKIVLPALERDYEHTSGNHYVHFLAKGFELEGEIESVNQSYLVFSAGEIKVCFTGNENVADANCQYIVVCKRAIKSNHLEEIQKHFRQWMKHPSLKPLSTEEVNESWKDQFHFIEEDKDRNINGLRTPQVGAIYSILGHLKLGEEIGVVVLPTGTGKTETMLSVLIAGRFKRVLVIVPTHPLRTQISRKFKTLGYLKEFGIVGPEALIPS